MDSEDDVIPEVMKPMFEASQKYLTDAEIRNQKRSDDEAAWNEKSISIESANEFLDAHQKTGMFLVYWDQDESSDVTLQSLSCGKSKADRVTANMLRNMLASRLGNL